MGIFAIKSKKQKFNDPIKLKVLTYDPEQGRYIMKISMIERADLPPEAVHETGIKNSYVLDCIDHGTPFEGFNAIDLNLYMVNNSINDALSNIWTGHTKEIDWKQLITYGVIGIIAIAVLMAVM